MQRRLKKELEQITTNPPPGISCFPRNDDLSVLDATIMGQSGTPYESGIFKVEIQITEKYPYQPPSVRFMTQVYHPNIDDHGRICLNLLKLPPSGGWRPIVTIEGILIALQILLSDPNPNDPLMADIASEYMENKDEFERKAAEFTKKYACSIVKSSSEENGENVTSGNSKHKLEVETGSPKSKKQKLSLNSD